MISVRFHLTSLTINRYLYTTELYFFKWKTSSKNAEIKAVRFSVKNIRLVVRYFIKVYYCPLSSNLSKLWYLFESGYQLRQLKPSMNRSLLDGRLVNYNRKSSCFVNFHDIVSIENHYFMHYLDSVYTAFICVYTVSTTSSDRDTWSLQCCI